MPDAFVELEKLSQRGFDYHGTTKDAYTNMKAYLRDAKTLLVTLGRGFDPIVAIAVVRGLHNEELKSEIEKQLAGKMSFARVAAKLMSIAKDDATTFVYVNQEDQESTDLSDWEHINKDDCDPGSTA
ncbi:hypothetical protein ABW21_db0208286 [Orbilia brochopaga]|nr:hypothetical protein ABW21_db0208286 [Drechslerella brochopaga]